jgi:putative membrane protein
MSSGNSTSTPRAARAFALPRLRAEDRFPLALLAAFGLVWLALAIHPRDRLDWLLENLLVFLAIPLAIANHRRCPLSRLSYSALALFFLLHAIGAHYTYSEVPIGRIVGDELGLRRNHFDRVVHFGFGLLASIPLLEVQSRVAKFKSRWGYLLPIAVVGALSAHYEIVEWLVATIVSPTAANAYLGTQGDEWDSQKDTLCALAGAIAAMAYAFIADRARRRPVHLDHCRSRQGSECSCSSS